MSTDQEAAKKRLGSLITEAYKAAGETRLSVADAIGLSSRSLYTLEMGQSIPRKHTQERLEEFFGWKPGSISELLNAGDGVDFDRVSQRTMRAAASAEWVAEAPAELDETARRIQEDAKALSARLFERERAVEALEGELKEARQTIGRLQSELHEALDSYRSELRRSEALAKGLTLAADDSPNRGAALRSMLDEVAEGNQAIEGEK